MSRKSTSAALTVVLLLMLVPRPSHAAPERISLSAPSASLVETIQRWWNLLLHGAERSPSSKAGDRQGCGMDPNGQLACDPGGGTNQTAEPSSPGLTAD